MRRLSSLVAALVAILVTTAVLAVTTPAEAAPRKWPRGPITYVDRTKDPDAVRLAVQAWNRSGLDIRFKKVGSVRRADVVIQNTRRVPAGCGTGYGTLGYPGPGRKAVVSILHGTDADGQGCAWPGQTLVVAHELGHVLGLEHYMKSCSLMNTSHVNGVAGSQCIGDDLHEAKPGRWRCRLLEPVDLRAARRLYGGRPRLSDPEWCDAIDRIPATGPVVHATPQACTAVPDDETTRIGLGLWGATPPGASVSEYLYGLPPGLQCITVWQFDQGNNYALAPTSIMVDVPATRTRGRAHPVDLPPRSTPVLVRRID